MYIQTVEMGSETEMSSVPHVSGCAHTPNFPITWWAQIQVLSSVHCKPTTLKITVSRLWPYLQPSTRLRFTRRPATQTREDATQRAQQERKCRTWSCCRWYSAHFVVRYTGTVESSFKSYVPHDVNHKPSKTECFVQYRGRGASTHLESHRHPPGSLNVEAGLVGLEIKVVKKYKYLCGVIGQDGATQAGATQADGRYKNRQGMSAYAQLAGQGFGLALEPCHEPHVFQCTHSGSHRAVLERTEDAGHVRFDPSSISDLDIRSRI